jgi:hypothetical protein
MPKSINEIIKSSKNPGEVSMKFQLEYSRAPNSNESKEIERLWGEKTSSSSSSSSSTTKTGGEKEETLLSKVGGALNTVVKGTASVISSLYETQMGQSNNIGVPDVVGDTLSNLSDNGLNGKFFMDELVMGAKVFTDILKQESVLQSDINSKTTITGQLSKDLREDIQNSADYAAKFGMSMGDLGDLYSGLVESSGKFALINRETILSAIPAVKAFGGTMTDMARTISTFENVGIGANNTIKTISDAGVRSVQLGLSGKKVTEEITKNIERLNQYGFQNGIKGLEVMVRKSLEFKMSLDQVYQVAEKVMSPEGALEMTANLQMLGGAIGDFNDPIKMMYDATNNVEGLQDALHGAAQSLTTYNTEQGRFEITGANLRRAKEMASVLNVDYKELTKSAIAGAERMSATTALMSSGLNMSDKDKEFLINMSRMEGGQMVIKVPESISEKLGGVTELALDNLNEEQAKVLSKYQKDLASMDTKDIAMGQYTLLQQIHQDLTSKVVKGGLMVAGGAKGVLEGLGGNTLNNIKKGMDEDIENTRRSKFPNTQKDYKDKTIKMKNEITNWIDGLKESLGFKAEKSVQQLSKEEISDAVYNGVYRSLSKTWDVNVTNMVKPNSFNDPQTTAPYLQPHHK